METVRRSWRWYFRPRRIMAAMIIGFFGHVAAYPNLYTSDTYQVIRETAPLRWWGVALTVAGIIMFATTHRHPAPVIAVGALLCAWTAGLIAATVTGESQSPAGAWFLFGFVQLLIWGTGRTDLDRKD